MKNLLKSLALVAVSALAVVSCQKDELASQNDGEGVFFSLRTGDAGKTYIVQNGENYKPQWNEGDEIGVLFEGFASDKEAPAGKLKNSNPSGDKAAFEGKISGAPEEGNLYAFYPAKVAKTYAEQTAGFDILVNQKPTASSFDPAADLLISKPVYYVADESEVLIEDVSFARALAMLKINVYSADFAAIQGQFLSKLTVTAVGDTLSGRPVFNLAAGNAKAIKYNTKSESVSAIYDGEVVSVASSKDATNNSVFLMVAPVTLVKDAKLKFEGETSGYKISKEVTLSKDIVLTPGKCTEINLSIAEGNCEVKGDYSGSYLIVSGNHLLTDFNTSNYYNYVEAAGDELADFWEIAGIDDYVWTVDKLNDGSYSFCNNGTGKYLALTANSNNAHQADNADENTARFSIAAEESALTIYSKAYPERKLRCNTSSPRFAFYGSTSSLPVASLLAYTPDPRPKFDAVSGLSWDASGKTLSWTAAEGATNGYEYTKDNGETVTASETNSIDCSSWTNGDYSVKVRVVGTEAKKTSEWSSACEFTISGGEAAKEYKKVTEELGDWSGEYLLVYESSETSAYIWTGVDAANCFVAAAISDNSISSVPEGAVTLTIATMDDGYSIKVNGGDNDGKYIYGTSGSNALSFKDSECLNTISYESNVVTIVSNTSVLRYNSASNNNRFRYFKSSSYSSQQPVQLYKLEEAAVTSITVSGTPTKTAYSVGEAFDTDGLVVTATYADASQKDITNSVDWTVTPETLSAGTTSVKVVATYKGVTSNEYVVNGLSVKALNSISVKTAPTKVVYTEGEKFDPAGLVIYRNYSDSSKDEYAYAGNESDFEFNPTTSTPLATSVTSVTITYSGKSVNQAITVNEVQPLSTMDEIFAAATATEADAKVKFNNWVVSGVKGNNAYVTDGTKGLIIYQSGHGFEVGDILSGTVQCKLVIYQGSSELKGVTTETKGLTVTKGGTITPATIAIANLSGVNTGAVITFESLQYNGSVFSDGVNTITPFNTFGIEMPTLTSGKNYTVTGIYIHYNGTKEIAPRATNDIVPFTGPYLNASASKTSGIAAAGETVTITVDTNVEGWNATSSDNTNFAISNKTATSFDVVVSENESTTDTRSATITVSATGVESKVITLTQSKKSSGTGPAVGTVLWGENFAHFGTNTPSAAGTGTGTTIYGEASITYAQSSNNTKGYNDKLAGGTAPELLLSKSNQTWTISGIPCAGVTEMSLTFLSNKTAFAVSSTTTGITVTGSQKSWTIKNSGAETFTLEIKNTSSKDNARIDNVVLKVTAN